MNDDKNGERRRQNTPHPLNQALALEIEDPPQEGGETDYGSQLG